MAVLIKKNNQLVPVGYSVKYVEQTPNKFKQRINGSITEVNASDLEGITQITAYAFFNLPTINNPVTLPNGITYIGGAAFQNCSYMPSITIPNTVTQIDTMALAGCRSLRQVTFDAPAQITQIGNQVFSWCTSLVNIDIPETVTTLAQQCFQYCVSMPSIILPSNVASIGQYVFLGCSALKTVVIENTSSVVSLTNSNAFQSTNANLLIYVPNALIEDYKIATNWVNYASKFRPAVATVADLSNIDTNSYTQAWVYATSKIYTYDGTQWSEV